MQAGAGYTKLDIQPAEIPKGFFGGEDGLPTWRDALDVINPLEHIPFISELFDQYTGHKPSPAAQIAGGALFGGPIGFMASVINLAFETETGHGMGESMVAALLGEDTETTQLAANDTRTPEPFDVASVDVPGQEILPPIDAAQAASLTPASGVSVGAATQARAQNPVLELYGSSAASAHRSYQNAQLRPYLNDVTHSLVL
ncbi:MAG: hypothetical protein ACKVOE_01025 [Rickettsiales bacterium]